MRRRLLLGALTAGLFAAGFAAASFPALAELRVITITLVGGQQIVTTVDVPAGTPPDQIKLPEITTPVAGINEGPPLSKPKSSGDPNDQAAGPNNSNDSTGRESNGGTTKSHNHKQRSNSPGTFLKETKAKDNGQTQKQAKPGAIRKSDGTPTSNNPTLTLGLPGPAPIGVPNFVIDKFQIPPFLLPIYQAAGSEYGIRWEVLAAINEIETNYGRNLNVSSAGALGWMQFLPSTWRAYGVDANNDGEKDPYNPVDAIFAAARYLKAAGGDKDLRQGIFAYNHADWYVDSVLMRARLISGLPADLVGSLTGLTQGHFPVHAKARYADDLLERDVHKLSRRVRGAHNAAKLVTSNAHRRSINIFARSGAPVIAVNDGVVKKVGNNKRYGRYVVLRDVYGNRYIYAHLGSISKTYPVPRTFDGSSKRDEFRAAHASRSPTPSKAPAPEKLPKPKGPATAGKQSKPGASRQNALHHATTSSETGGVQKERLFASPQRTNNKQLAQDTGQLLDKQGFQVFRVYFSKVLRLRPSDVKLKQLKKGSKVIGGTVLGRIGTLQSGPGSKLAPHLNFSIRPAGRGAPRIDPKPILDGWKLLEATALYRAAGKNPFVSATSSATPSVGQILLMSKETLQQRVLNDPNVKIYPCGREDVQTGQIDRRVMAVLEFLAISGLHPTVTSLKCGHSYYTAAGGVSDHPFGRAVDIAEINGTPIYGHQGPGSITETTIGKLMTLQGTARPYQIISLMNLGGPSFALPDHYDHIHVGFPAEPSESGKLGRQARALLSDNQWDRFVSRLTEIQNPVVHTRPSKYSIKVRHRGRRGRPDHRHGD